MHHKPFDVCFSRHIVAVIHRDDKNHSVLINPLISKQKQEREREIV